MTINKQHKIFNSNILKLIAIIAMTIDHITWSLTSTTFSCEWWAILLHIIGRITCPIMCFFVAEGFFYTKNINKYTARLFLFALISHIPYMLVSFSFDKNNLLTLLPFGNGSIFNQTSVMWGLAWGLVMLRVSNSEKIKSNLLKVLLVLVICVITFPADWSCISSLMVLFVGSNRGCFKKQSLWILVFGFIYGVVYFFFIDKVYGIIQLGVVLSLPFLYLYNGERGKNKTANKVFKWLFYIYYPLHLFIIYFFFELI